MSSITDLSLLLLQIVCFIITFQYRQSLKKKAANKYINKVEQKMVRHANKPEETYDLNPIDELFKGDIKEKAIELEEKLETWEKRRSTDVQNKKVKKKVKKTSIIAKPVQKMKFAKSKALKKKKVK